MFQNYKIWLSLTVIFAILAALLATSALQNYVRTVKVAVAARDIQREQVVSPNDVGLVSIPKAAVYADAVLPQQIIGHVAKGFIPKGTVLRNAMFQNTPDTVAGKLSVLGAAYSAVAIPNAIQTNVASTVQAGDRVDIYAVTGGQNQNSAGSEKLLAHNVLVLQGSQNDTPGDSGSGSGGNGPNNASPGLVVALRQPELDQVLPYMTKTGQIVCALVR